MNEKEGVTYRAYLLRLWNEDQDASWRLSLEHARSGERRHFATVQQLGAYLETLIAERGFTPGTPDETGQGPGAGG